MAHDMGVPGYADPHTYNYVALAFWLTDGPTDIALLWSDPIKYMGTVFGNTKAEAQSFLKKKYSDAGVKLLVSAFGSIDHPTDSNAVQVATNLANFVKDNMFDGVDIDYEHNSAMEAGTGKPWLKDFTIALRNQLPGYIISHAPQAPYFSSEYYDNLSYTELDQEIGHLIDFYNVQFYNQGRDTYSSYDELFVHSTNGIFSSTAVKDIINRGVPSEKIVVGKPALPIDANNGYVDPADLGNWAVQAYRDFGWSAGIMYWQYISDLDGLTIKIASELLVAEI